MMDHSNVDYLFQVTAALAERRATNPYAVSDDAFGVHFAQASESNRSDPRDNSWHAHRAGDRPEERPAFDVETGGAFATHTEPESAEHGDCADPTQPLDCFKPEPSETNNSTLNGELKDEDEPHEADDDTAQDAGGLELSLGDQLVSENVAPNSVTDVTLDQSDAGVAESNAEAAEHSETARIGSHGTKSAGAGTENLAAVSLAKRFAANFGKPDAEPDRGIANSPLVDSAGAALPNATASQGSEAAGSENRNLSANAADAPEFTQPGGATAASERAHMTVEFGNKSDKAPASRRAAAKSKVSDNPGRSKTDGKESIQLQNTDPAGPSHQVTGAISLTVAGTDAHSTSSSDESKISNTKTAITKSDILPHALGRSPRAGFAGRGARADSATPLPRVDATRFVGRVAKAIQTASERGGALQLRLSPPELGALRVQLTVDNGVMSATLEADTSAARQVLLDHLPALRERLADQNIRIERFDVDVRQDGSSSQSDARASQHEQRNEQPHHSNHRRPQGNVQSGDEIPRDAASIHPRITNNGINVLA